MLLTITTTDHPATDIGYLLGQNPNRCQSFSIAFGQAHVFYPIAGEDQCAAALLLYIDPVALVRGRRASAGDLGLLAQYVNDRPYVASSFLSVAIASVSDMLPLLTIEAISPDKLVGNQSPVIGALVVTLPGRVWNLMAGNPSSLLPRGHPLLAVAPSGVDAHLDHIRELAEESVIAVASISQEFLRLARALLAPVVGGRHAMEEHLLNEKETKDLSGTDLVFCDTTARRSIRARRIVPYHLISSATAQNISDRTASSEG